MVSRQSRKVYLKAFTDEIPRMCMGKEHPPTSNRVSWGGVRPERPEEVTCWRIKLVSATKCT